MRLPHYPPSTNGNDPRSDFVKWDNTSEGSPALYRKQTDHPREREPVNPMTKKPISIMAQPMHEWQIDKETFQAVLNVAKISLNVSSSTYRLKIAY